MAAKETFELDLDAQAFNSSIGQAIKGLENLEKSMSKAEKEARELETATKDTGKGFSGLADAAASAPGPLGAVAGQMKSLMAVMLANPIVAVGSAVVGLTVGLGKLAHGTAEANDQIIDLADATGIAATELSRYQVLAEKVLPSENIEKLAEGFSKLSVQQRAAFDGNEDLQTAFEYFGVTSSDSAEMLNQLADGFNRTAGDVDRTAFLVKIFGDGLAKELAPALALGSEGIRELTQLNDEYGRTLDEDAIRATEEWKNNLDLLSQTTEGLAARIGNSLIPQLNSLFAFFTTDKTANSIDQLYDQFQKRYQEDLEFRKEVDIQANESYRVSSQVLMDMAKQQHDYIQEQERRTAKLKSELAGSTAVIVRTETKAITEQTEAEKEALEIAQKIARYRTEANDSLISLSHSYQVFAAAHDPVIAAQLKLANGEDLLDTALAANIITIEQYTAGIAKLGLEYEKAGYKSLQFYKVNEGETPKLLTDIEAIGKAIKTQGRNITAGFNNISSAAGSLVEVFGGISEESTRAAKAAFAIQQAAAAASVIVSTIQAIMLTMADLTIPSSAARIALATTIGIAGAASLAAIAATTIGSTGMPNILSRTGSGGNVNGSTQPGSNGSTPGPGAAVGTGKPTDDTFTDTPGPITARAGYNTFRFSPGDMIVASKSPAGLGNQLGNVEILREARNQTALLEEIKDLLSMNQTTTRHTSIGYRP